MALGILEKDPHILRILSTQGGLYLLGVYKRIIRPMAHSGRNSSNEGALNQANFSFGEAP